MTYKLETKKEDLYLSVIASGARTSANIKAMADEVIIACTEHKVDKVLIDVRNLNGRLSIFDSYTLISSVLPQLKNKNVIKKAVIVDDENRKERTLFFNKVAKNINLNIRIFGKFDKASEWLNDVIVV